MLVEFRTGNFRSFREEQVLSLVAGTDTELPGNCIRTGGLRLLRSAGIYGPNASGKSNLVKALEFLKDLVTGSAGLAAGPAGKSAVSPFLLDAESGGKPSSFEITFILDDVRHQYGFTLTRDRIHEEWLYAFPRNRPRRLFERRPGQREGGYLWRWGPSLRGQNVRLSGQTRLNSLFLSVAAQFNHKQLTPVYEWISKRLRVLPPPGRLRPITAMHLTSSAIAPSDRDLLEAAVLSFLKDADLGIKGLRVRPREVPEAELAIDVPDEVKPQLLEKLKDMLGFEVEMVHENTDTGKDVLFDLSEESDGTRRFFGLAGPWIEALNRGYVIFVDEIEASLHPLLTRELVRLLHSPGTAAAAQLVFATHDTTLLDPELLRRDQVWFTEKDEFGATHLYSLSDYKEHRARKGEAMQKGYLAGRYGAVPILEAFGLR